MIVDSDALQDKIKKSKADINSIMLKNSIPYRTNFYNITNQKDILYFNKLSTTNDYFIIRNRKIYNLMADIVETIGNDDFEEYKNYSDRISFDFWHYLVYERHHLYYYCKGKDVDSILKKGLIATSTKYTNNEYDAVECEAFFCDITDKENYIEIDTMQMKLDNNYPKIIMSYTDMMENLLFEITDHYKIEDERLMYDLERHYSDYNPDRWFLLGNISPIYLKKLNN